MMLQWKELIVVLCIASAVYLFAKPVALKFIPAKDFNRRRNVWFALTVVALISPSFWVFAVVAIPVFVLAGRRDSNPTALYVSMLHVIPPLSFRVPIVGLSSLFDVNNYLLLAFCVMMPAAWRLLRRSDKSQVYGMQKMDFCLLGYGILTALLYLHPEIGRGVVSAFTYTDSMRRAFTFIVGIFIPYFVVSRSTNNRQAMTDILASFCVACTVLAAIAVFEYSFRWLLYGELPDRWGAPIGFSNYYFRGESVRAAASSGQPLGLGYLLAIAFGFWFYLRSRLRLWISRASVSALYCAGLFATMSRGPWIGTISIYFAYVALGPRALSKTAKAICVSLLIVFFVSLSPLGDKIANVLPFVGATATDPSVLYRQRLLDRAWEIIQASPLFGDQYALLRMQDLRQGEGIIDVVNTYVQIMLGNGFVGLFLFLSFIFVGLYKAWVLSREVKRVDPDLASLGACLVSCILGTLLMIENGSFGAGTERMFYILGGLAMAYNHFGRLLLRAPLDESRTPHARAR
jgi:O-antigen ligase